MTRVWHVQDTCRPRETITNLFLGLKNPHFDSEIIKIGQETPDICFLCKNMCLTHVGHMAVSPINFLSRTLIQSLRSSKSDQKHQRYGLQTWMPFFWDTVYLNLVFVQICIWYRIFIFQRKRSDIYTGCSEKRSCFFVKFK